ncbi:MAG: nucleoside triphosphate pyrophosphohydrolase, partial [Spartobacteria bacterium]
TSVPRADFQRSISRTGINDHYFIAPREAEIGDLLFSAVNLARKLGVDAETALSGANKRFLTRFRHIEQTLRAEGREVDGTSLEELDRIWEQAKRA